MIQECGSHYFSRKFIEIFVVILNDVHDFIKKLTVFPNVTIGLIELFLGETCFEPLYLVH